MAASRSRPANAGSTRLARAVVAAGALGVLVACQATTATDGATPTTTTPPGRSIEEPGPGLTAPPPSVVPSAIDPADESVAAAVDLIVGAGVGGAGAPEIDRVALSGDLRQGWVLSDALGLASPDQVALLARALETLTGQGVPDGESAWVFYSDLLLAWEVPAPPGYLEDKAHLYGSQDGALARFFDPAASLDWRTVTWSGAGAEPGSSLDGPEVGAGSEGGSWLQGDDVVFGVVVGGEARAYPRRVLAVHEVVNDTVGGRSIVVARCAACGATVAYDRATDADGQMFTVDGTPLDLATTSLLERGAPLLYDRASGSIVRSLLGQPVTGLLASEARILAPIAVRTTTWAAWAAAFPETSVISDDAGVGRVYLADPSPSTTAPPARPTGTIDDRLVPGSAVLGVPRRAGEPVAFSVPAAAQALAAGEPVEHAGVRVVFDGGGLAAVDASNGTPLAAHEANWLAWSQFHPTTEVWTG